MEVQFAFLAGKVTRTPFGRLNIEDAGGAFFPVPGFPALLETVSMIFSVFAEPGECGRTYKAHIDFWDEQLGPQSPGVDFDLQIPKNPLDSTKANNLLTYQMLPPVMFQKRGEYELRLSIEGQVKATALMAVDQSGDLLRQIEGEGK